MKTPLLILFAVISIAFTACDLNGSSNFTPEMRLYPSHISKSDTLNMYLTDESGVLRMDTINVGDTVVIRMYLNGSTNNLTSFYLAQSDTSEATILLPVAASMDSIFSKSQSDYDRGKFIFLPKKVFIYFPIRYVARKPSNTATLQFSLASDANFENGIGNNSIVLKLKTPIVAKPVTIQ